jgi:hypothetical protein
MASFSKQWCEKNDPNMPWDFDILEVASRIEPLYGISIICEGYGFTSISKDIDDEILLGFPNYDFDTTIWKDYKEVVK